MIASGDAYANKIYNEYNKAAMTAFPTLSNAEIDNILAYIKEGPKEEEVAIVDQNNSISDKGQNNNLLYIIFAIILCNAILLVYVKNVLKDAAGVERMSFLSGALLWLRLNPSFVVFFCIVCVFCI